MKIVADRLVELFTIFVADEDPFEAMLSAVIVNMAIPIRSSASCVEIHDIIADYCKEHEEIPFDHDWTLVDGCLCMDGKVMKRVAPKDPRPNTDAFWTYIENRFGYTNAD